MQRTAQAEWKGTGKEGSGTLTTVLTMEPVDGAQTITKIVLQLSAKIPGISDEQFQTLAGNAKAGCPVSRLLKAEITLEATLA